MAAVISLDTQTFLGHNQATYQDLRLALQLNLRRQLLLAVCDDVALQTQLARRLEIDLNPYISGAVEAANRHTERSPIVTLRLDTEKPDLVRQVLLWLKQHRLLKASAQTIPAFQILGIEQLTRRSPTIQNKFLASLIHVDALITRLDCRVLIWVPRPWLGKIQQAVPEFWQSRSGLFEFAGDPTPTAGDTLTFEALPPLSSQPPNADSSIASGQRPRQDQAIAPQKRQSHPISMPNPTQSWGQGSLPVDHFTVVTDAPLSTVIMPPEGGGDSLSVPEAAGGQRNSVPDSASQKPGIPPPLVREESVVKHEPSVPLTVSSDGLPEELAQDEEGIKLWHYVKTLEAQQAGPLTLSRAYLGLGQISRDRIETGTTTQSLLDFAIAAYRKAVPGLLEGDENWCDALNDLASLYWLRSQQDTDPDTIVNWLKLSIGAYQTALSESPNIASPETLLRLCSNLGTVYSLLASLENPLTNLEQSQKAYQQALQYSPVEILPLEYANLQNSLGAVHWRLAQLDQLQHHLHRAIMAYSEALRYRSPQSAPLEYAMIQNNLGIAYWSLAQHEHPRPLLEKAIEAYHSALLHRTLERSPSGCAATNNNLGTAFWDLAQQHLRSPEQRLAYLQQAVMAYENALNAAETALKESPAPALGFDLWATFHSAGVVHDQLAQSLPVDQYDQRQRHLQQALQHYLLAYQGWQDNPQQLEVLVAAMVYNLHLSFEILGLAGQQAVLSQVPGDLLPQILRQL